MLHIMPTVHPPVLGLITSILPITYGNPVNPELLQMIGAAELRKICKGDGGLSQQAGCNQNREQADLRDGQQSEH